MCLALSRPRRHCHDDHFRRYVTERLELKTGTQRNRQAHSWLKGYDLLVRVCLPPHLALAADEVPDLFHRSVSDRLRDFAGWQLEVCEAPSLQLQKRPHL